MGSRLHDNLLRMRPFAGGPMRLHQAQRHKAGVKAGMIGFWVSAVAMAGMVAVVLLQSLLRARGPIEAATPDLDVYRDQLAEVGRDLARGTLTPADGDRLRLEVQRRMLDAHRVQSSETALAPSRTLSLVAGVVVLALLAAGALYWTLGVPGYPDLPLSERLANADATYNARPTQDQAEAQQPPYVQPATLEPQLAALLTKLRDALKTRPDDLQGHLLLAQNEASLGNFVAARKAQEDVIRLKGAAVTPDDLSFLAYTMVRAAGGLITPQAEQVVVRLLKLDPRNGWGRFYSGLMFVEIGRPDRAFALWQPLLAESPPDAPWYDPIHGQIADIAAAAGINYTLPNAAPAPGPDAAAGAAAAVMSDADRTAMIRTMVDGLEARLASDGGPVEDWSRLITSLTVLKDLPRATAAYAAAQSAFAGKPGDLAALQAAAKRAGLVP